MVLTLIAVMATLVSPGFQRILPGQELRASAHELAAALRSTRAEAIHAGAPRQLQLNLTNGQYGTTGDAGRLGRLPSGVQVDVLTTVDLAGPGKAAFRFFPDGSALGGRITLRRDGRARIIDIDWLTGRVALETR